APEGWHVPTDAEWTTLEEHLIANGYNYDQTTTGNKIAKAMASITGWNTSTVIGAVGNNQSQNNSSGFNAYPEGLRWIDGFNAFGVLCAFWSSSSNAADNDEKYWSLLELSTSYSYILTIDPLTGLSVRFVRD
ncbi:fibrobacter succinogenes major paralogous domain-containing protein, partial [Polaribacter sp.]|nr:fibrobacter succinogenes major paralogous domain-containing protein [Polaribacter sp.]